MDAHTLSHTRKEAVLTPPLSRRSFALGCLALGTVKALALPDGSRQFAPWSPGELDIHHIDTGRGNATFLLCPDGTTILIDCGTAPDAPDTTAPIRPNSSRSPGEWVARYALHHARAANRNSLDYLVATHIHPDHVGDLPVEPSAPGAPYTPTGLSQVDALMPATVVIDRSFPDYGKLPPPDAPFANNYLAWLSARQHAGKRVEALRVGSDQQIRLNSPHPSPEFSIRGLTANGRVWTGTGSQTHSIFPDLASLPANQLPPENCCSIALRLSYGLFRYYTGGDLNADTHDGRAPWLDVETPTVTACGRVEVAVADHHAYFDSCGPAFVKNLDAQAYVIPSWHLTHPGQTQLERLLGAWSGEQHHDVFATEMLPANRLFNARWVRELRSTGGHVVVRVAPGGSTYRIFVLDSAQEQGHVLLTCGPYTCRRR